MVCVYLCPYCWQENETELHPEDGDTQDFVEDCRVCCQPMHLTARYDHEDKAFTIVAEREAGD